MIVLRQRNCSIVRTLARVASSNSLRKTFGTPNALDTSSTDQLSAAMNSMSRWFIPSRFISSPSVSTIGECALSGVANRVRQRARNRSTSGSVGYLSVTVTTRSDGDAAFRKKLRLNRIASLLMSTAARVGAIDDIPAYGWMGLNRRNQSISFRSMAVEPSAPSCTNPVTDLPSSPSSTLTSSLRSGHISTGVSVASSSSCTNALPVSASQDSMARHSSPEVHIALGWSSSDCIGWLCPAGSISASGECRCHTFSFGRATASASTLTAECTVEDVA